MGQRRREESGESRLLTRLAVFGAALAAALAASGCSMTLPGLGFDPEITSSVERKASPLSPVIDDVDWRLAAPALGQALDPLRKSPVAAWTNSETGGSGAFEAVGAAYVRNDEVCRAFKASVRVQGREEKLVGAACRLGAGEWTVQKAKSAPPPG
jgi:hypothetical protein